MVHRHAALDRPRNSLTGCRVKVQINARIAEFVDARVHSVEGDIIIARTLNGDFIQLCIIYGEVCFSM